MSNFINLARQRLGAFDVNNLGGKVLWLKADSGVYLDNGFNHPTDGQTVQQWNDLSGRDNHASQGDTTRRPVYNASGLNGLPTISFDGSNDFLKCPNPSQFDIIQPTAFLVAKVDALVTFGYTFFGKSDYNQSGVGFRKLQLRGNNDTITNWYCGSNSNSGAVISSTTTNWNMYGILAKLNNLTVMTLNGIDATKTATVDNTTFNSVNFVVGAGGASNNNTGADFGKVTIAELILFNRILPDYQYRKVIDYLATKWGIAVINTAPVTLPARPAASGRPFV